MKYYATILFSPQYFYTFDTRNERDEFCKGHHSRVFALENGEIDIDEIERVKHNSSIVFDPTKTRFDTHSGYNRQGTWSPLLGKEY